MNLYKVYNPDHKAEFFNSLAELRKAFDFSPEDVRPCFYKGIHVVNGIEIITI